MKRLHITALCAVLASAQSTVPADLTQASLEELASIQVTSVAKKSQSLSKAAAAVYVITQDDIRRSGMANIPDLLRMVPGVDVARIDANSWAIGIRGFNYKYSDKVLVLIDGRTVYTPGFSGVYWDQQDMPLEDIDRIEVIRGPGGTVWGANAVNGVINIITKHSQDTPGGLITAGTGSEENAEGLVQYGGAAGRKGSYRLFGRYFNVSSSTLADGSPAADAWHGSHEGFRSDWNLSSRDTATVQGDLYQERAGQTLTQIIPQRSYDMVTFNDRVTVDSGNILGRWEHTLENGSQTSLQLYYDRFDRFDQATDVLNTLDLDFQYHFAIGSRQDLVAGTGFRFTNHDYRGIYDFTFAPPHRDDSLFSTFLQDEIALTNSLSLTAGSKFEHNAYTGFEFEPSVQLTWTPTSRTTLWASAAQAIRQPSWYDANSQINAASYPLGGGVTGLLFLHGNPDVKAEQLRDFEVGYRTEVARRFSVDITGFRSYYRNLQTFEPQTPYFAPAARSPLMVFPSMVGNLAHARTYGLDLSANIDVTGRWRLSPSFSFLQMNVRRDPGGGDPNVELIPGDSPKHGAQLRSTFRATSRLEWDASAYFVSTLQTGPAPSYTRLDTQLRWKAAESVELSVGGQNLLTPRHFEFLDGLQVHPTEVERSVLAKITWHF